MPSRGTWASWQGSARNEWPMALCLPTAMSMQLHNICLDNSSASKQRGQVSLSVSPVRDLCLFKLLCPVNKQVNKPYSLQSLQSKSLDLALSMEGQKIRLCLPIEADIHQEFHFCPSSVLKWRFTKHFGVGMTGSASWDICEVAYCARCAAKAIPLALEVDLAQATTNCLEEVCASLSRAMEVARTVLE